jgi:hypothetical protein
MKLIVLDFFKDITYIYTVDKFFNEHDVDEFLINKSHRPTNCQWMLTKNEIIII